jgi:hypothetical protein
MEAAERFQEIDETDQLINARAVLYHKHLIGSFHEMLRWYFEAGLPGLQKILYILYLWKIKKGIEVPPGIKKDIEGLYLFPAFWCKVGGVAFKDMGKVGSQPVDLVGSESMHVVIRYQGAFTLLDPCELYLFMTVKMGIEVRQYIFLHDDSLIMRNRDGELQNFHISNIRFLRILPLQGQNEGETG